MRIEQCAYKPLKYYPNCTSCFGRDKYKICYITAEDLKLHLEEFNRLFSTGCLEERKNIEDLITGLDEFGV